MLEETPRKLINWNFTKAKCRRKNNRNNTTRQKYIYVRERARIKTKYKRETCEREITDTKVNLRHEYT